VQLFLEIREFVRGLWADGFFSFRSSTLTLLTLHLFILTMTCSSWESGGACKSILTMTAK
jgi:hypothetical protein